MTQLDDHLAEVERYGLVRDCFPLEYNGHRLLILSNDAHIVEGRLLFDFTLYCDKCGLSGNISERLPADSSSPVETVANARVAVFDTFESRSCEGKI